MAELKSTIVQGNLRVTDEINAGAVKVNGTNVLTSHQSVSSSNNTASWGSAVVVGTVGGTQLKFTMPSNPDSWRPVSGSGSSSDAARADHNHSGVYQPVGNYLTTAVTKLGTRTGDITIANLRSDIGTAGSSTLGLVYMGDLEQNTNTQYLAGTVAPMKHTHSNYLTTTGTAADSDKLDGHDSSYFATSNHNHNGTYLLLAGGGTITASSGNDAPLTIKSATSNSYLKFTDSSGTVLGYLGVNSSKKPVFYDSSNHQLAYTSDIPSVSNATITIKQTGQSDQTFTLNGSATTITLADNNTTYNNATTSAAGLMSSTDKTNLDAIVASLNNDDSDSTVNRLKDVLSVFNDYPEGTTVLSALNGKLSLSGGTMTGGITLAADSSAYNTKGIIFNGGSRIGENTSGHLGLYATGELYLRPGCDGATSTYGLKMTSSDFSPTTNKSMSLGTASYAYNNIYATTIYENGTALSSKYLGISAAAASAAKLNTNAGSATNPVYFSGGVPVACTYSLSKSVPSDAVFTDHQYTAGTGLTLSSGQFSVSSANVSTMLNLLSTGSSTPTDADYYISQYVGGGTSTTTYHRRPMSALWAYVKAKGAVTSVNSTSPDSNGNVTISIPAAVTESTVSGWGFTKNAGTVTSVSAGTGLSISGTASTTPTVNIASGYKLPTTTEWNGKVNFDDFASTSAWGICTIGNSEQYDTSGSLVMTGTVAPQGHTHSNYVQSVNSSTPDANGNVSITSVASATSAGSATVSDNVSYLTTAPSSANTSGRLKFVVLSSEPSTKYSGYVYIITGS